jgi:hypothetical protein
MSEINATFVVDSVQLTITPQEPSITVTPEVTELRIFTGGFTNPGGNVGELQYNAGGFQNGVPNTNFSVLTGNLLLGNVPNVKITGGVNGYFLQTDGAGNLTWQAGTGNVTGNGTPGGSNTQIQFNDQGNFGGAAGLTFDNTTNVFTTPGNIVTSSNILANNITANANITALDVSATFGVFSTANVTSNLVVVDFINIFNGNINSNNISTNTITGTQTITSPNNFVSTGTMKVQQVIEKVTVNTSPATSTIDFDLLDQAIVYYSANASSNFTLNFRGNSSVTLDSILSSNQSITCTFINTNGVSAYYANVIQIDGSNVTPKWVNPPVGQPISNDFYTFNIIKTAANTFAVFGTITGFV